MDLLQKIFLYFAKYPNSQAVERFFNVSSNITGQYNLLKTAANDLLVKNIFPEITDYIFGVNEESVRQKISNISDIYLFIDYGNIISNADVRNVKTDVFRLAVTVAKPTSASSFDQAEELLMSEKLLNIICSIRNDMRNDNEDSFLKWIIFPNEITPFFARELSNSYGWTLMFQMQGVDVV